MFSDDDLGGSAGFHFWASERILLSLTAAYSFDDNQKSCTGNVSVKF